ncbi:GNAT family N-acetyltransferase [Paracandidimonas soli]|uniref:Putative GNAT family N-acyltransferase n=1 Tax=Paracandidimonas soli TaxID=1917182 RepID=A0A4R3UQ01_9BURK|nr:GNAT family N-acetyltransferase [Paracandidimonas soli]TCU92623.1 putative GNAT family N-acyltransferase [Paracandidimonas soli]
MSEQAVFQVLLHEWQECEVQASLVRKIVFIDEQGVSLEEEMDGRDDQCVHAVAWSGNTAVGTGRLLPEGSIGRMAVLREYRGRKVGSLLLTALVESARSKGYAQVYLAAQEHALPFYLRHGFIPEGERFFEAGIAHVMMRRHLSGTKTQAPAAKE